MGGHCSAKQKQSLKRCYMNVMVKLFAAAYLLFFIGFLLNKPTTAHFYDIESASVTISAADNSNDEDAKENEVPKETDIDPVTEENQMETLEGDKQKDQQQDSGGTGEKEKEVKNKEASASEQNEENAVIETEEAENKEKAKTVDGKESDNNSQHLEEPDQAEKTNSIEADGNEDEKEKEKTYNTDTIKKSKVTSESNPDRGDENG